MAFQVSLGMKHTFVAILLIIHLAAVVEAGPRHPSTSSLNRHPPSRPTEVPAALRQRLNSVTNDAQFVKDLGDVLYYGRTAVIRFYTERCYYCHRDRPNFMELIDKFPNVNFFRVNVDHHPNLAREYGIRGVPTYHVVRRSMAHLTWHKAADVAKYLTQLRQTRQQQHQYHRQSQYHHRS